jgi:4-hydroxy-2-oxoglutarate aldolase
MAGVGGHSTKQDLENLADAADAGANYALLLPPGYSGKRTTPAVINNFFDHVAKESPLPIVIYNFPTVLQWHRPKLGNHFQPIQDAQQHRRHEANL